MRRKKTNTKVKCVNCGKTFNLITIDRGMCKRCRKKTGTTNPMDNVEYRSSRRLRYKV